MDFKKQSAVVHPKFGRGNVLVHDHEYLTIKFDSEPDPRKFSRAIAEPLLKRPERHQPKSASLAMIRIKVKSVPVVKSKQSKHEGKPCRKCGGTTRYIISKSCVHCQLDREKKRRKK